MKYFELYGDREITQAEYAAQVGGCRAAVQSRDWKDYDRMLLEMRAPIVSWTLERPTALPNWRGELIAIDDADREEEDTEEADRGALRASWLQRYALDRKARRVAEWAYRWLCERGYIRARAQ